MFQWKYIWILSLVFLISGETSLAKKKKKKSYKGPGISAINSCNGKSPGQSCEFMGSNNAPNQGTCHQNPQDEVPYCLPNGTAPAVNAKPVKDPNPKPEPKEEAPKTGEDGFKTIGD